MKRFKRLTHVWLGEWVILQLLNATILGFTGRERLIRTRLIRSST